MRAREANEIIPSDEKAEFIEGSALEEIKVSRDKIREEIFARVKELTPQYGIELIDIRVKRINYVEEVRKKVYERMIAERKRVAEKYRSEGRGIKAEIEGKTGKEIKTILSQAYKEAQKIKGKTDSKATKIYADAHNRDSEFYFF